MNSIASLHGDADADDLLRRVRSAYQSIAPDDVFFAVAAVDDTEDLMAPENAIIARAVPARRRSFTAGRRCARQALAMAGGPRVAIPQGRHLEPIWPPGFSGSLTHDGRLAAAAVHRWQPSAPRIGIDLIDTPDLSRFDAVAASILSPEDRSALGGAWDPLQLVRIFSAKEAAIKVLSGDVGRFMEFSEIAVQQIPDGYLLHHPAVAASLHSKCRIVENVFVTVAVRSP